MNERNGVPGDVRQWSAAEQAAFARHEDDQRLRQARELSWTQKLEALGAMNDLAYRFGPHRPRG